MDTNRLVTMIVNGTIQVPSLLLENYHVIGLDEQDCMLLIEVHSFLTNGITFPTFNDLCRRMTLDETACADKLQSLIQRGFLSIIQKQDNQVYSEAYSLQPLWEKLVQLVLSKPSEQKTTGEQALFTLFETEFGRPLSPIECETLAMWLDDDHFSPQLIKAALRESVISGKLNFRYIDRILFNWRKAGIKSLDQAKAYGQQVRNHQQSAEDRVNMAPKSADTSAPAMPTYDWLDKM